MSICAETDWHTVSREWGITLWLLELGLTQYEKFPSTMLDALPWWCAKLGTSLHQVLASDCAKLAHKKLCQIYWISLRKYFLDIFELVGQFSFCLVLLNLLTNFYNFDIVGLFGHLLDLFGLVSPLTCTKIPLRAENPTALISQVWHKPYYTRCPLKFSVESHY